MRRTLIVFAAALAAACGNGERPGSTTDRGVAAKPQVRLVLITDLQGHLEPCGCQSRPLGGMDRMATVLKHLRADGVPTALMSAGDLLFAPAGGVAHPADAADHASQQERWRAETMVDVLNRVGLAAYVPGPSDRGAQITDGSVLFASLKGTNLAGRDPTGDVGVQVLDIAGFRLGVVGVRSEGAHEDVLPQTALSAAIDQARAADARLIVTLVSGSRRFASRVARLPGVDFVLSGGTDDSQPTPPAAVGNAFLFGAGRHGEGLVVVDVFLANGAPLSDASAWSQARQRENLQQTIQELRERITTWKAQPDIDSSALAQQQARLATLEAEHARPAPIASGNRFDARWLEIGPELARDPEIDAVLNAYDRRVNEHNRTALAHLAAPAVAPGQPRYVGSDACKACHQKAHVWWSEHPHGRAYTTLQELNKEYNLNCVGCHVTGYGQPGGSTVVQNAGLTHVGCESCHGPGSLHIEDPDAEPATVQRETTEALCVACHNPEHSDKFHYETYRARLLVPGHGKPATVPTP